VIRFAGDTGSWVKTSLLEKPENATELFLKKHAGKSVQRLILSRDHDLDSAATGRKWLRQDFPA
jgi:hypothetical protein